MRKQNCAQKTRARKRGPGQIYGDDRGYEFGYYWKSEGKIKVEQENKTDSNNAISIQHSKRLKE